MSRSDNTALGVVMVAGVVFLAIGLNVFGRPEPAVAPTPAPVAATVTTAHVPMTAYGPASENNVNEFNLSVTRVIDGDTFELGDGQRVRVLGIDSCEMSTAGGPKAKIDAERLLAGGVVLRPEPSAPDKDRYGRLLRYVWVTDGNFGDLMVAYDHTGVYAGKNDASPGYVAALRALDTDGRNCAGAPPPAETRYVPLPSGGDDNHKSRFCRRHWYC